MAAAAGVMAILESTYNSLDLEAILELYADDARFSAHLFGLVGVDKSWVRAFYSDLIEYNENVEFVTRCVTGTPDLTVWECDVKWTARLPSTALGTVRGDKVVMRGVSLLSWRDGYIVEQKDYFHIAQKGN
ncbi:hypothetical protein ACHAPE_000858 [Trichoderma viride]